AEDEETKALRMKSEYADKLASADEEAQGIIKTAAETADRHGEKIISDARDEAERIMRRSMKKTELEREEARKEVQAEAAALAADIAEKLLAADLEDKAKDDRLINDIIGRI
ncbi:MAG: ATP synthase F0 subunit B, partial [Firmicutes bacterium]|nr:ATP synthase F0 subunit B [Bacillota bacterium]